MKITLDQALSLAGNLEDEDAISRFRGFVQGIKDVEDLGEYLKGCLEKEEIQYHKALCDLVCCLGPFLGFENGFDGRWKSHTGISLLLEVAAKESQIKIDDLMGRIEEVEKTVPEEDLSGVLGMYVVHPSDLDRAEEVVLEEDEVGQVRVVSVSSLLLLAEMAKNYDLAHEDVLLLLLSSGPVVDALIDLMGRLIARCEAEIPSLEEIAYMLEPFVSGGKTSGEDALQDLIDQGQYYAFGNKAAKNRIMRG